MLEKRLPGTFNKQKMDFIKNVCAKIFYGIRTIKPNIYTLPLYSKTKNHIFGWQ